MRLTGEAIKFVFLATFQLATIYTAVLLDPLEAPDDGRMEICLSLLHVGGMDGVLLGFFREHEETVGLFTLTCR